MNFNADTAKSLSTALLTALAEGRRLVYLIDLCASALCNPVLVSTSQESRFFCSTKYPFTDPSALQSLNTTDVEAIYKTSFEEQNLKQRLSESSAPLIFDGNFEGGTRRIVGRVMHEKLIIGYVIILESNKPFEPDDIALAQITCNIVSIEMQRRSRYLEDAESSNYYIGILLSNRPYDRSALTLWLRRIGWENHANFYTFSIDIGSVHDFSSSVVPMRHFIETMLPNCKTALKDNMIIVLANPQNQQQLEKIKQGMKDLAQKHHAIIGMSPRFGNLNDLPLNSIRASDTLSTAQLLYGIDALYDYDVFRLQTMLLKTCQHIDPSEFCHEALDILLDNDKQYKTSYYATLYEFVRAGGELSRAAKNLFIHRNTLTYRLNKIADLIHVDLDSDDMRMFLYLSYKMNELQEKLLAR